MKKNLTETTKQAARTPDCVTEIRRGNKIITARGFFNTASRETAIEKIERLIRIEGEASGF